MCNCNLFLTIDVKHLSSEPVLKAIKVLTDENIVSAGESVEELRHVPGQKGEPVLVAEVPQGPWQEPLAKLLHLPCVKLGVILGAGSHPGQVIQDNPGVEPLGWWSGPRPHLPDPTSLRAEKLVVRRLVGHQAQQLARTHPQEMVPNILNTHPGLP